MVCVAGIMVDLRRGATLTVSHAQAVKWPILRSPAILG